MHAQHRRTRCGLEGEIGTLGDLLEDPLCNDQHEEPERDIAREKRAERSSTTRRRRTRRSPRRSRQGVRAERGERWLLHGSEVPPPFSKAEVLECVDRPLIEDNGGILVSPPDGEISPCRPGRSAVAC